LIDVSVPNKNEMCDASRLAANEHKCHNKSNVFAFRLIVGFIQKFQSRLQQDLVDLSLSNVFSITKLDFISIKAKSNSAILIDLTTSQQKAMIYFYNSSSQFIVKYIYLADSEGEHTAISCNETPFRALEVIVVSTNLPLPRRHRHCPPSRRCCRCRPTNPPVQLTKTTSITGINIVPVAVLPTAGAAAPAVIATIEQRRILFSKLRRASSRRRQGLAPSHLSYSSSSFASAAADATDDTVS